MGGRNREACAGITLINVEKSLTYGGCPICRAVRASEEEAIKNILYESVNDPSIRKSFRESLGLCPYHAWLFVEVARRPDTLDGLGSTIIYEDILSEVSNLFKEGYLDLKGVRSCPLCRHAREVERNLIEDMVECFDARPELLLRYEESESSLCLRHYSAVYSRLKSEEARKALREAQERKINELLIKMREYIRKADYRVKEPVTQDEALAWVKAVEVLKGFMNSSTLTHYFGKTGRAGRDRKKLFRRFK